MLKYLIKNGYVNVNKFMLENYPKFELNEVDVVIVLKLFEMLKLNQLSISVSQLAKKTSLSNDQCANALSGLFNRGLITINLEYNKNGKAKEAFNLDEMIDYIEKFINEENKKNQLQKNENAIKKMISICEDTFSRELNATELDFVINWTNENYDIEKVKKALDIASQKNIQNIKYVDQILLRLNQVDSQVDVGEKQTQLLDDFFRNIK